MAGPRAAGAVVLGSDYRGLAVVRSLGRRGIPVWVLTGGDDILAAKSRYALRQLPLEGAGEDERCAFLSSWPIATNSKVGVFPNRR